MLFDLESDRGDQHDVADQNSNVVKRLLAMFEQTQQQVPDFPVPRSDFLFAPPATGGPRTLMRLIGGDLRYDQVPVPQQSLVIKSDVNEK